MNRYSFTQSTIILKRSLIMLDVLDAIANDINYENEVDSYV